ncbi:MAG: thrombospondin type 3 repeat-containing protein [bacterium]
MTTRQRTSIGRLTFRVGLLLLSPGVFAETLYVDVNGINPIAPYTNWATAATAIGDAVGAANDGDTVRVTNGTYVLSSPVYVTRGVTVQSVNGPALTVVDGGYPAATNLCFYLMHANAVVEGFTITHGRSMYGGGVLINGGGCVRDCVVRDNGAVDADATYGAGGGIYCWNGGIVSNCTLEGNWALVYGGGVNCDNGGAVEDCVITNNFASWGAGVHVPANSLARNCLISGNVATHGGGGVFCAANGIVDHCAIVGNSATGSAYGAGGGAYCWGGGTVSNSVLEGNWAMNRGGGAHCESGGVLENLSIVSNAATDGGAVSCYQGGLVRNCMINGNTATLRGGGVFFDQGGSAENCTVSGNGAFEGGGVRGYYGGSVLNSIVYLNSASNGPNYVNSEIGTVYAFSCTEPDPGGAGNITSDPQFTDAAAGDYHPATLSPCLDAGTNQAWMAGANDAEGKPRILNDLVDIGAYESIPTSWDANSNGLPDYWEWRFSGSMTGITATADDDGDGYGNWEEYRAGTDPTNSRSFLGLQSGDTASSSTGIVVRWSSVAGKHYRIERSTNLVAGFDVLVRTNILAVPPMNTETDTTATGGGPWLYRIGLE